MALGDIKVLQENSEGTYDEIELEDSEVAIDLMQRYGSYSEAEVDTPLDADTFNFWDTVDSVLKKITWANVKTALQSVFDLVYVPLTRTVNGLALSSDIVINTSSSGIASHYIFCDDVIFGGTIPVWHELEKQSDGGVVGSHTATTTSYTELDRYVTAALGTTIIPEGLWSFALFCKMSGQSGQIKADIYRVDSAGAIVGGVLGTAESAVFTNTNTVAILCSIFIAEKTGWAVTDRIGIVMSGKKVGSPAATLTFYHNASLGYVSEVITPLVLLHNQLAGLNDGDYTHLTAAEKTVATQAASAAQNGYLASGDFSTFAGKQAALTFGIAQTNAVLVSAADAASGEYAKFTASGLESRSTAEVASDIGASTNSFAIAMALALG
jgi:hypothetical protein